MELQVPQKSMRYQTVSTENKHSKSALIVALSQLGKGSRIKISFLNISFKNSELTELKTCVVSNFLLGSLQIKKFGNRNFLHDPQKAKLKCAK